MGKKSLYTEEYEIKRNLSKEELIYLFQEAQNGNNGALEDIVLHNLRLVFYEVKKKFNTVKYDKQDLISIGTIGLMQAIRTYDYTRETEFSTYAISCIYNSIYLFLKNNKKHQKVESLDRVIGVSKNGNDLRILDTIQDDQNIQEDYTRNETYKELRRIINNLNENERKAILLYFGFTGRRYKQNEIANIMGVSSAYISNIIDKGVKKIGLELIKLNIWNYSQKQNNQVCQDIISRKKHFKTIYEFFNNYSKKRIDEMISLLDDEDRELLYLRYGNDLERPVFGKLSKEERIKFYGKLVPKMRKILSDQMYKYRKTSVVNIEKRDNDSENMKNILNMTFFKKIMEELTNQESMIILLKIGYINGCIFTPKEIASYLCVDENVVIDTIKKVLWKYRELVSQYPEMFEDIRDTKCFVKVLSL